MWWLQSFFLSLSTIFNENGTFLLIFTQNYTYYDHLVFVNNKLRLTLSAIFFGLTVHFKIYPIVFAMVFYCKLAEKQGFFNLQSIKFGIIAAATFFAFTFLFYKLYGFECLYESLLYHLVRKDHR